MYTRISLPQGRNSGSSIQLATYLNKDENTYFIDKNGRRASIDRVVQEIDSNRQGLKSIEDKFYMISFSPSEYELEQMIGRKVNSFDELTELECTKLFSDLKEYTAQGMDKYAQAFDRENIKSGKDLVYFSRIETSREYHHYDKEVFGGKKHVGDKKEGLNAHVHVIVCRKAANRKTSLSPNMRFRNKTFEQGEKTITRGFDYTNFTQDCHKLFREKFQIKSNNKEYDYARTFSVEKIGSQVQGQVKGQIKNAIKQEITQGNFSTEMRAVSQVNTAIRFVKTVQAVTSPQGAVKELLQRAVNIAQKIQSNTMKL